MTEFVSIHFVEHVLSYQSAGTMVAPGPKWVRLLSLGLLISWFHLYSYPVLKAARDIGYATSSEHFGAQVLGTPPLSIDIGLFISIQCSDGQFARTAPPKILYHNQRR